VHRLAALLRLLLLFSSGTRGHWDNEGNYHTFLNFRSPFAWWRSLALIKSIVYLCLGQLYKKELEETAATTAPQFSSLHHNRTIGRARMKHGC
jgi:hypothetical protein